MSRSSDGRLEVKLSRPWQPGARATNPEQLFAAGLVRLLRFGDGVRRAQHEDYAAGRSRGRRPRSISVPKGGAFSLAARLYVSLPGMERADGAATCRGGPPGVSLFASNAREHRRRNDAGLRLTLPGVDLSRSFLARTYRKLKMNRPPLPPFTAGKKRPAQKVRIAEDAWKHARIAAREWRWLTRRIVAGANRVEFFARPR